MRHARRSQASFLSTSSSSASFSSTVVSSDLCNVLLEASVTKSLSESGTRALPSDPDALPLSDGLLLQILRRPSLHISKKVDFFRWCSLSRSFAPSAAAYSCLLRALCRTRALHHVPSLLHSMKLHAVPLDPGAFKLLLDAFIRAGKFDSALEILDYLQQLRLGTTRDAAENENFPTTTTSSILNPSSVYNSVILALVRKNHLPAALSIFSKLSELDASQWDVCTCNALLVALRKAGMRSEFRRVFDTLRDEEKFAFDAWGYNICIHAFGCWGDLGTCLKLFMEMKERSLSSESWGPDLCTYNSMIQVLCFLGKAKDALSIWEELKESGHRPDSYTYRILIQGCSKSYRLNDANGVFDEMRCNGFQPDAVVYNSLLDGLLKAKKVSEACHLFEKMVQDGVRATCWTYNILINGMFSNGRAAAGCALFCNLKKKGQFVDAITYSIVVLRLCKENQLEDALNLVEEMEARGFVVDLVTVTTLLIALHRQGRWDWTEKLMKHIRDGSLVPDIIKWKANMEALLESPQSKKKDFTAPFPYKGSFGDIMALLSSHDLRMHREIHPESAEAHDEELPSIDVDEWSASPYMDRLVNLVESGSLSTQLFSLSRGQRIQMEGLGSFDIDMVNTYLCIFLAKGKLSLACKLFELFTDMGVEPVTYTYNSMITSFVKKGYFNEAWGVFEEMGEGFCPADIATYNLIIQSLGKMGKADLASTVLNTLMKQGGYLDIVMYNTLINALGKAGRLKEAKELFEQMKTAGINPDVVTFNTLIEVHCKAGQLKDAYGFLKMMLDAGCSPNHVTDTILDFLEKELEKLRYQKASIKPTKADHS